MATSTHTDQYTELSSHTPQDFSTPAFRGASRRPRAVLRGLAASLVAATLMGPGLSTGQAAPAPSRTTTIQSSTPAEMLLALLDMIYQLLGGDPQNLQNLPLSQVASIVCDYYYAHGIPANLSGPDREALSSATSDVLNLNPWPSELSPESTSMVRKCMTDIWTALH